MSDSRERERRVQKAVEDFYIELDAIAVDDQDVNSTEWLAFLANQIGEGGMFEGYSEWVQEVWEPVSG